MARHRPVALLDAGDGRRLERFGRRIVDRPAPAAAAPVRHAAAWAMADLRFERGVGWQAIRDGLDPWIVAVDGLTLELRPTEAGQVGLFPEHIACWRWLAEHVAGLGAATEPARPPRVLNLFAYTGGATLAAAAAGATVSHVDASRPALTWARRNAALSGLAERPIRWLADDATAFVRRERRRGAAYDAIVLDPPSYGHAGRRAWRLADDLPALLEACAAILDRRRPFVLLTAHTPGFGPDRLADLLADGLRVGRSGVEADELVLTADSGARLTLGAFARWTG